MYNSRDVPSGVPRLQSIRYSTQELHNTLDVGRTSANMYFARINILSCGQNIRSPIFLASTSIMPCRSEEENSGRSKCTAREISVIYRDIE